MGDNPSEAAQLCIRIETDEKEVQDTSCRGSGGVPQLQKPP